MVLSLAYDRRFVALSDPQLCDASGNWAFNRLLAVLLKLLLRSVSNFTMLSFYQSVYCFLVFVRKIDICKHDKFYFHATLTFILSETLLVELNVSVLPFRMWDKNVYSQILNRHNQRRFVCMYNHNLDCPGIGGWSQNPHSCLVLCPRHMCVSFEPHLSALFPQIKHGVYNH